MIFESISFNVAQFKGVKKSEFKKNYESRIIELDKAWDKLQEEMKALPKPVKAK